MAKKKRNNASKVSIPIRIIPERRLLNEKFSVWFGPALIILGIIYLFQEIGYLDLGNVSIFTILIILIGMKMMRHYERHA